MIRAEGFAKTSIITMIIGSGLNIILDPIFIFTLGLGIKGAAFATVIAQLAALSYALMYYIRENTSVKLSFRKYSFDAEIYKEVLKIGIPVFVYQFLSSLSIGIINNQAAEFGSEAVAAMGITTKILAFMSYIVFGFVKGLQPIVGYNYGAGLYQRLKEVLRCSSAVLTFYCVSAASVVLIFKNELIGVFTEDPKVFFMAEKALTYWSLTFILLGFQMTYITAFLALGKAKEGSILGLSRQGLILIPLILIFKAFMDFDGIILAQSAADLLTFIISIIFVRDLNKELFGKNIKSKAAINNIR
jgi:putative MATE family efflux protein